ncbi:MAG: hypothetical protein M1587_11340 [Thaumarchaeota archaeon]|nr:hypothetical protein [Nitrososphaerota archaeon]
MIDSILGDARDPEDSNEQRTRAILSTISKRLAARGKRIDFALPDRARILEERKKEGQSEPDPTIVKLSS